MSLICIASGTDVESMAVYTHFSPSHRDSEG